MSPANSYVTLYMCTSHIWTLSVWIKQDIRSKYVSFKGAGTQI